MKIYICGKITGVQKLHYVAKFKKAEDMLAEAGFTVANPCALGIPDDTPRSVALKTCLPVLRACKAVYLLDDWWDSAGSIIEKREAEKLKMDIYYQYRHCAVYMNNLKKEVI